MIKLAVSPGDPAGIGPDICIKAFSKKKDLGFIPVIFGDVELFEERAKKLNIKIEIKAYSNKKKLNQRHFWIYPCPLKEQIKPGEPDISYAQYIMDVLKDVTKRTLKEEFKAIVTGPINKELMNKGGIDFQGHTEVLAKLTKTKKALMLLTSKEFKIALTTTHVSLNKVPELITFDHLVDCIKILDSELKKNWNIKNPLIKILGLNPHAGDGGYLGNEERDIIFPAIKSLKLKGYNLVGPVSADTAFIEEEGSKADAFLAMYHDQGLPVMKTSSFGSAVNITLGLPLIRTSVDHGTAYELAGNKEVNERSLLEASTLALKLVTNNKK